MVAIAAVAFAWGAPTGMLLLGFPAFALAGGMELAEIRNLPSDRAYPKIWRNGLWFFILAIAPMGIIGLMTQDPLTARSSWRTIIMVAAQLLTLSMTLKLIYRRDPQFIYIFFWGLYVFSLLFVTSPYWTVLI
jgi:hypothetical protein